MPDIAAARNAIEDAIGALSLQMWRGQTKDEMVKVDALYANISIELDRIDSALGPKGKSMFASMAENVRQCITALYEARQALAADCNHIGGNHNG